MTKVRKSNFKAKRSCLQTLKKLLGGPKKLKIDLVDRKVIFLLA